jgi:hypothetical protein
VRERQYGGAELDVGEMADAEGGQEEAAPVPGDAESVAHGEAEDTGPNGTAEPAGHEADHASADEPAPEPGEERSPGDDAAERG